MIVGQEKICNLIDKATLDTFPRSLMLVGPRGGGKHLICEYISSKLDLQSLDITETLTQDSIEEIYERVQPYLYLIRINEISIKEENTILKFLEEPLKNSYIILTAETDIGILPTILNRCQIWYLQNYKKEFLKSFITSNDDTYILEIATTPGQVKELQQCSFSEMISLADKMIDKISIATIPNTLTLSNRLAFKNEKDKFNTNLFIEVLRARISSRWKLSPDTKYVSAYMLTSKLQKDLYIKNIDHKALFENYLLDLRTLMKGTIL